MTRRASKRRKGKRIERAKKLARQHASTWRKLTALPETPLQKANRLAAKELSKLVDDIAGVQPMTGPVSEIFKMKVRYERDSN